MAELQRLVEGHQTNGGLGFIPQRPSVRLGDIGGGGDQYQQAPYDSHVRQRPKWSNGKEPNQSGKPPSRTRTLTNLSSGHALDEDPIPIGALRVNKWVKETAAAKRGARSSWAAKEDEELEEGFRDFSREDSESPEEEEENRRKETRYEMMSGVKIWLRELGLGRYWPMFEMHEVDEEVLPLLTLEDLKDMGINVVGSRRKMFCAIQKLGRVFLKIKKQ
ncbi:hypothetical protein Bca52824_091597 [Brassica carinata]|uniref:SAM domain-containing protein n=1 Tax=Brassica carinata TaxID=52824 RepID=A0A8X7TFD5_BRACI|nr:hypothetical protein Bca52824_091597 [Brassica carinata]